MEDHLRWKTAFDGRQPSMEDDLQWSVYITLAKLITFLVKKKYRNAEYVQRCVPSSNVQVLFVFEVVLIVLFH